MKSFIEKNLANELFKLKEIAEDQKLCDEGGLSGCVQFPLSHAILLKL